MQKTDFIPSVIVFGLLMLIIFFKSAAWTIYLLEILVVLGVSFLVFELVRKRKDTKTQWEAYAAIIVAVVGLATMVQADYKYSSISELTDKIKTITEAMFEATSLQISKELILNYDNDTLSKFYSLRNQMESILNEKLESKLTVQIITPIDKRLTTALTQRIFAVIDLNKKDVSQDILSKYESIRQELWNVIKHYDVTNSKKKSIELLHNCGLNHKAILNEIECLDHFLLTKELKLTDIKFGFEDELD